MNEKGSSLLVVLITVTVFMILGISLLTVALGGTIRTQVQLDRYENIYEGKEQLDFLIATFKEQVVDIPLKAEDLPSNYQTSLDRITDGLQKKYPDFTVKDITNLYTDQKQELFTRIYEFSVVNGEAPNTKTVKKRIVLSPAPSFLDYALGSYSASEEEGRLNIHGSPNVDGDVIANHLLIKNEAEFKDLNGDGTASTPFAAINGNVDVQKNITVKDTLVAKAEINIPAEWLPTDKLLPSFFYQSDKPEIFPGNEDFVHVDFKQTYLRVLNEQLSLPEPVLTSDLDTEDSLQAIRNKVILLDESTLPQVMQGDNILLDMGTINSINGPIVYHQPVAINSAVGPIVLDKEMVINGDLSITAAFNNSVSIKKPLVVVGDLTIDMADTPVDITGTVVVHGDLIINGNEEPLGAITENDTIKFDSVIYAYGESFISNTNIEGIEESKQLVLFSNGPLTITRINEFNEFKIEQENENIYDLSNETTPLKAFFYTEDKATLYGVGSMFHIHGGLFAKKELIVNAFRGNTGRSKVITPAQVQEGRKTRFQVVHDPNVLVSQVSRLPIADRLRVIVDDSTVK
ncbi:hypothetical protein HF078_07125 [Bacillus sp. RO2]|uniref:hypothetical protein n=1 Tax=Bacillus sp. RO2 TaxID=2723913 RepID=UPI00145DC91D|nr:hypothetical protein [Bacillus sp. RO2]NMH72837.1 hypothetical protein [Bacillus sp. RO2]